MTKIESYEKQEPLFAGVVRLKYLPVSPLTLLNSAIIKHLRSSVQLHLEDTQETSWAHACV